MLTLVTKYDLEKIPETIKKMPLDEFISKGMGDEGLDIDEISPIVIEANSLMEFVDKDILYSLEMYKEYNGVDIHFYDCNKIKEYTNDIKTYDNTINDNTLNNMTSFIIDYYQKQIKELKAKAETPIEKEDKKVEEDKNLTPEEKIANENDFLIGRSLSPEETFKLLNNNPYKIYTIRIMRTTNSRPDYYDVIANHKDAAKKLFSLDIEHGAIVQILDERPLFPMILH